jgi:Xaa-Pro aminopeptidase
MSKSPYEERIARVQELMAEMEADLLALSPSSNMLYLSGFYDEAGERLLLLLIPRVGGPIFLVPELYAEQVRGGPLPTELHIWRDASGPEGLLERALRPFRQQAGLVLVDDTMGARFLLMLEAALPGAKFSLASQLMARLRMEKGPEEIRSMAEAAAIVDQAFAEVIGLRISGLTELALARTLEEAMAAEGAEKVAFETLVASGPNSALPHYRAGQRRIEPGDVVILDFGCRVRGYCSDITRTVVCADPPEEFQKVYEVVREAQERAVRAVKPGIPAGEVDRTARETITMAGYGERFIHRTGHGIGLDVHEEPYISPGSSLLLRKGMTFSIEPGIYLPGRFGVRIEDIVVVTDSGGERLNNCTHALQVVA